MNRFLQVLYSKRIRPLIEDKILFKGARNDAFSVSSMYRVLECFPQVAFPSRSIWNSVVPPRMGFFAWEVSRGKVLTLDQLKRRGRALANRCFLCEEDEEDINHLLIHCKRPECSGTFCCRLLVQVGLFRPQSSQCFFLGEELRWVKNEKTFGLLPLYAYS